MGQDRGLGVGPPRSSKGGQLCGMNDGRAWQALDGPCEARGFGQPKGQSDRLAQKRGMYPMGLRVACLSTSASRAFPDLSSTSSSLMRRLKDLLPRLRLM